MESKDLGRRFYRLEFASIQLVQVINRNLANGNGAANVLAGSRLRGTLGLEGFRLALARVSWSLDMGVDTLSSFFILPVRALALAA